MSSGDRQLGRWSDRRVGAILGGVSSLVLALIAGMIIFVLAKAWPSFSDNGLSWFAGGHDVDVELQAIFDGSVDGEYTLHAWPLLWGTLLTTGFAMLIGIVFSTLAAIFLVEFAPERVRRVMEPAIRLLAAVPSVVYGLLGLLILVPFVNDLIGDERRESVGFVVQLNGNSLLVGTLVLVVMISPIMIAIIAEALRGVPKSWLEGSAALGVNRWRTITKIGLRTIRPAIVAAAVLATARALGEAIMLSMVSGSRGFAPNPLDGLTFFFEPVRPLAATIVDNSEGLSRGTLGDTLYAFGALLLISSALLSMAGYAAKLPMRKYGIRS